jgi:hypothetical protein
VGEKAAFFALQILLAQHMRFDKQVLATDLKGGYQVVTCDVNGDGKLDVIALGSGHVRPRLVRKSDVETPYPGSEFAFPDQFGVLDAGAASDSAHCGRLWVFDVPGKEHGRGGGPDLRRIPT